MRRNESGGRAGKAEDARPSGSEEQGCGGTSQAGGPVMQKMPARLAARRSRVAAERVRRAGRANRRCPPVWQRGGAGLRRNESGGRAGNAEDARPSGSEEEQGCGGTSQAGGPVMQKMPARLAARRSRVAAERVRRAGRASRRCPPVWQRGGAGMRRNGSGGRAGKAEDARPSGSEEEQGCGGTSQAGGPVMQKMPARLAARRSRVAAEQVRRTGR